MSSIELRRSGRARASGRFVRVWGLLQFRLENNFNGSLARISRILRVVPLF